MKKRAALCLYRAGEPGNTGTSAGDRGSEDHGNRRVKLHGAVCDGAVIGPDMDAVFLRLAGEPGNTGTSAGDRGSEDHGNRRVKLHGAVCDGAVIGPDMDAVFLRLF